MSELLKSITMAQAAWLELEGAIKALEAATLRGDRTGIETARQRAHDLLDAHMDMKAGAMVFALRQSGGG